MLNQVIDIDVMAMMSLGLLLFLIMLILYVYLKISNDYVLFIVYIFCLIIGINSFSIEIPMTPYFQTFFIVFCTVLLLIHSIEIYNGTKKNSNYNYLDKMDYDS